MEQTQISSREEAIQKAKDWQQWVSEQNLSYGELAEWGVYFNALAESFDLREEFEENGII